MRKAMKAISWLVFLAFIGLSSFANYLHGSTTHARIMLAVVPVGFAASVFIFEGLISQGRVSRWTFGAIGFVALASGVASYLGLFGMARDSGIGLVQALLLPLAFDGVVLVASMGIRGFSESDVPVMSRSRAKRVPVDVPTVSHVPVPVSQPSEGQPEPVSHPDVPVRTTVARGTWDKDKARRLLAEGRPAREVAELCGVSRKTIDRLPRNDVEE